MFEKVSQIAEQAAPNVSRRQFLGRFGRSAAAIAAALGGLLALPQVAHAGKRVQGCNGDSTFDCSERSVGNVCGSGGRCWAVDKKDKSSFVRCYFGRKSSR